MKLLPTKFLQRLLALGWSLVLTLMVVKPYFHHGVPYTHDGRNHLARFANYKLALKEGQFPPRFAPNLMNRYGYPVFNYNYPLANILSLPLSFLNFSYELTFKIIVTGGVWFGLWGVYRWLEKLKIGLPASLVGMIGWASSPFLISTILFRGNVGEVLAMSLFPWLLVMVEAIADETDLNLISWWRQNLSRNLGWLVILTAFLLSHNVTVLFGIPLWLIYGLIRFKLKPISWLAVGSLLAGSISLSLWFWLPAVVEKSLVVLDQASLSNNFMAHFPSLTQLLFSPLRFGFSYLGQVDSLSLGVGLMLVVSLLFLVASWSRLIHHRQLAVNQPLVWLSILTLVLVGFQLQPLSIIWHYLPLANFIQFPWRWQLFLGVFGAGLIAVSWQVLSQDRWWRYLFSLVILIQVIGNWRVQPIDYIHYLDRDYQAFAESTTTSHEDTPVNFRYLEIGDWQPQPTLLTGQGQIEVELWRGSIRRYKLRLESESLIVEPTMNFAGWMTQVKNVSTQQVNQFTHYIDDELIQGRLAYRLPAGEFEVTSRFTQRTWSRLVGNAVSAIAILLLIGLIISRFLSPPLAFYTTWKLALLIVSLSAGLFYLYQPTFPYADTILKPSGLPEWLYSWANFDGVHYLTIAQRGYEGTGLIQAFFPLFPLLLGIGKTGASQILIGLGLNILVGWWLIKNWRQLVAIDQPAAVSWLSLLSWWLFPTALFFNGLYTETLFMWLVIGSFLKARRHQWWRAGLLAALASATRIVGVMLVPALVFELWQQSAPQLMPSKSSIMTFIRHHHSQLLAISLGLIGLLVYMFYLQLKFDDPFYFFHVQAEFGSGRQESLILYPQVVWRYLKILLTGHLSWPTIQELMVGVGGLIALIWSWFKVRKSYVIFSLLVFLIPTLTGTFSSLPRYALASFAIFIWLGTILKGKVGWQVVWFSLSTLALIFNTILFIQGYWVA